MTRPGDGDEPRRLTRGTVWRRAVAVAVVGAVGVVYVGAAVITAGPITPMSVALTPAASVVTEPYLVQNWQLFAPDPISEERGAVARLRCADGTTTEFVDITSEHVEAIHATRFFPSRQSRIVSNSMFNLFLEDPYLARYRESLSSEPGADSVEDTSSADPLLPISPDEVAVREQGEQVLANFAHWSLADRCPEGDASDVQLRYVLHQFPRWSERHQWRENGETEILESGWHPLS